MSRTEKLSLKAFWEALEKRLAACSADELRAILRALAQETTPTERQVFLDKLKPVKAGAAAQEALRQDDLLTDIDDLVAEIKEGTEGADYWEEEHWGDYYGDEEDSQGPYEEFIEPLSALFDRAEAVFDYGNFALARAAYQKLFEEALQVEDDYGRGVQGGDLIDVDLDEARARYLRAVYETKRPAGRPQALLEQMRRAQTWGVRSRPMLNDLIQISPAPLPDQDRFLKDWIAFLRKQSGPDADAWLREAIRLAQGTQGLAELAQAEGKKRPRAYLDWFAALESEDKHREILSGAQAALKTLPARLPIRAAVADYLCAAAARLNETEALRAGRWEAFSAAPTLLRLLDLWEAAPADKERIRLMQQAADHIKDYLAHPPRQRESEMWWAEDRFEAPAWIDKSVLAHAYLLSQDLDAAHQLAAREKVLGWSSSDNTQGLVAPFCLVLLAGKAPNALPANLKQLWQQRLQTSLGYGSWDDEDKAEASPRKRLERIYAEHVPHLSLSKERQEALLAWCLEVIRQRVEAIVGNQHRGSYDKAALLIGAGAETLRARGEARQADALVEEMRQRFPRHRSFLAELDAVTQSARRSRR